MIKAIMLDVDGTLVSFETHKVLPSSVDALRKIHDGGIRIVIATGRAAGDLHEIAQAEVDEIIGWLTGYSAPQIEAAVQNGTLYGDFFRDAPQFNPDRVLIKGSICNVKLESIEEPLMKEIRYLDKLVDELTKGKAMEKIKRTNK